MSIQRSLRHGQLVLGNAQWPAPRRPALNLPERSTRCRSRRPHHPRGPSLLRGMLIEVAWVVWRKNPWAQVFVRKVSRGMKSRKKIAIVALARRLLVKLWAMLRTNTPWHEFGPPRAQTVT